MAYGCVSKISDSYARYAYRINPRLMSKKNKFNNFFRNLNSNAIELGLLTSFDRNKLKIYPSPSKKIYTGFKHDPSSRFNDIRNKRDRVEKINRSVLENLLSGLPVDATKFDKTLLSFYFRFVRASILSKRKNLKNDNFIMNITRNSVDLNFSDSIVDNDVSRKSDCPKINEVLDVDMIRKKRLRNKLKRRNSNVDRADSVFDENVTLNINDSNEYNEEFSFKANNERDIFRILDVEKIRKKRLRYKLKRNLNNDNNIDRSYVMPSERLRSDDDRNYSRLLTSNRFENSVLIPRKMKKKTTSKKKKRRKLKRKRLEKNKIKNNLIDICSSSSNRDGHIDNWTSFVYSKKISELATGFSECNENITKKRNDYIGGTNIEDNDFYNTNVVSVNEKKNKLKTKRKKKNKRRRIKRRKNINKYSEKIIVKKLNRINDGNINNSQAIINEIRESENNSEMRVAKFSCNSKIGYISNKQSTVKKRRGQKFKNKNHDIYVTETSLDRNLDGRNNRDFATTIDNYSNDDFGVIDMDIDSENDVITDNCDRIEILVPDKNYVANSNYYTFNRSNYAPLTNNIVRRMTERKMTRTEMNTRSICSVDGNVPTENYRSSALRSTSDELNDSKSYDLNSSSINDDAESNLKETFDELEINNKAPEIKSKNSFSAKSRETSSTCTSNNSGIFNRVPSDEKMIQKRSYSDVANYDISKDTTLDQFANEVRKEVLTPYGKLVKYGSVDKKDGVGFFKIMSYNILAQSLLEMHRYSLYQNHEQQYLKWSHRFHVLMEEFKTLGPDIICLQEVDSKHLKFLSETLSDLGYKCLYKKRTNDKTDGCAIYYRESMFTLKEYSLIEYYQPQYKFLNRDNVGIVARFYLNDTNRDIVVANTHLLFNPKRIDIKLAQIQILLAEIERIAFFGHNQNGEPRYHPIVLTGDFNSAPFTPVYDLIVEGVTPYYEMQYGQQTTYERNIDDRSINPLPKDLSITDNCQHAHVIINRSRNRNEISDYRLVKLYNSKRGEQCSIQSTRYFYNNWDSETYNEHFNTGRLKHNLRLSSAYTNKRENNFITTRQERWCTVDYIFYGPTNITQDEEKESDDCGLKLVSYLNLPTESEAEQLKSIPNRIYGSDHLSLMATFHLSVNV